MCKFPNHCNHKPEEFYGTVNLMGKEKDLYFFYSKAHGCYEYCLRYGEDGDYYSAPVKNTLIYHLAGDGLEEDLIIVNAFIDHMNNLKEKQND